MAITQGTWEVWQSPSGKWAVKAVYEDDQGNRHTTWPAVCNATGEDNEANARLIAAAPKLQEENARLKVRLAEALEALDRSDLIERLEAAAQWDGSPSWLIHEAIDRIRVLEAQLAEALEALEPFAMVAEHDISEDETDSDLFRPMPKPFNHAPQITVGHLRRARALLNGGQGMTNKPLDLASVCTEEWALRLNKELTEARAHIAALEAQLAEARKTVALFESYGCPICHGDCASANPPVYSCPMETARRVREGGNDD